MNGQLVLGSGFESYQPVLGSNGEWGSAGGYALRESLEAGSLDGVMDVLDGLEPAGMANILREAGFAVPVHVVVLGRDSILQHVQTGLIEAVERRVDGFALLAQGDRSFAAKETIYDFKGNGLALQAIQRVLAAQAVEVDLLGDVVPAQRESLQFIAGQAMDAGIQGFAFDGLAGKYAVQFGLRDMAELHATAASARAIDSVRKSVDVWRTGGRVGELSDMIPGAVQRILQASPSEEAAKVLVRNVDERVIENYAREVGTHIFGRVVADQGLDVNGMTVAQQAEELGLVVAEPSRERGKYAGAVVAMDHCSALVKVNRTAGLIIPFKELAPEQTRPKLGDMVKVQFAKGEMAVSMPNENTKGSTIGR